MIVFANGAPKSGSTWLFNIARELTNYGPPPVEYANPSWSSRPVYSIDRSRLAAFLEDPGHRTANILSKNHFGNRAARNLLLRHADVRVLNVSRDIRDVVVSQYYHRQTENHLSAQDRFGNFKSYYWSEGRSFAQQVLDYQIVWDVRSPRYLCVTYEKLLTDFDNQVQRIGHFLGKPPTPDEITRVQQATSPTAISAQPNDMNRFRKGIIGDWCNYLDDEMAADLAAIIQRSRHLLHRLAIIGPRLIRRLCRPWRSTGMDGRKQ